MNTTPEIKWSVYSVSRGKNPKGSQNSRQADTHGQTTTLTSENVSSHCQGGTQANDTTTETQPQPSTSKENKSAKKVMCTTNSGVMDKVNFMMDRFGELEKRIEQQERRDSSSLFILLQSSTHSTLKQKSAVQPSVCRAIQYGAYKPPSLWTF